MRSFRALRRYWRLLSHYLRPHWRQMALLGIVLLGTIGVQIVAPLITSRFIDRAIERAAMRDLTLLALLTMGLAVLRQGMAIAETYVAERVSWTATNELRADLVVHLLGLDASFHNAHTPGELIERVDGDVGTLAHFFSRFIVSVLGNGLLMLGVLLLLLLTDWRVGLALAGFVAVALIVTMRIRAAATPHWAAERQANADFYGFLGEYLDGREDIRSSGADAFVLRRCAELMRSWLGKTRQAGMRGYAMVGVSDGLFLVGTATAVALSAMLYRDGALTIGSVYLIFRYTDMLRQPIEELRNELQDLQQADASLGRIEGLLSTESRLVDGPGDVLPPGPLAVEFDGVSFRYQPESPTLCDLSLTLAPGRVLGVVGRTGSGKTTLTRLVPRFYDPDAGTVRLGGVDLRTVRLAAIRERIGLVSQEVHLFNASLRDNLTLFDDAVPNERIESALTTLGLADWRRDLPDGLATRLGPGGIGLSAGQAQLVACARIFLHDPDIVILDEASSRLDPATERLVHAAMERLLAGRTGIIVAHRLATIAFADDVLVLEDGQMREYGPRRELAADPDSRFAALLRAAETETATTEVAA